MDSQGVKPPPVFLMFNWDQCTRSFVEILNDKPVRKPCWIYFVGKFPGHKMFKSLPGFLLHSIQLMEEIMHPHDFQIIHGTVDGRNPSPVEVGSLSVYPIIYKVLYIPGGCCRIYSINSITRVCDESMNQ